MIGTFVVLSATVLAATDTTAQAATRDVAVPLQDIVQIAQQDPAKYGGVYYDHATNTVHVSIVDKVFSTVSPRFSALRSARGVAGGQAAAQESPVKVDRVRYSHAELQQVADSVPQLQPWASDVKSSLATWGIDPA
jgi:hypothetical protein